MRYTHTVGTIALTGDNLTQKLTFVLKNITEKKDLVFKCLLKMSQGGIVLN